MANLCPVSAEVWLICLEMSACLPRRDELLGAASLGSQDTLQERDQRDHLFYAENIATIIHIASHAANKHLHLSPVNGKSSMQKKSAAVSHLFCQIP